MVSLAFVLLLDVLLYSGLILALIRLENHEREARIFGRKLIGLAAFAAVLGNRACLGGVWFLDLTLVLVAAVFYHRAACEAGTRESVPLLLVATAVTGSLYMHPALAPGRAGGEADPLRACHSNLRTLDGATEMYVLDKDLDWSKRDTDPAVAEKLAALEQGWKTDLPAGQYLQAVPRCEAKDRATGAPAEYRLVPGPKGFDPACAAHGTLAEVRAKIKALPRRRVSAREAQRTCWAWIKTLDGATEMFVLDKLSAIKAEDQPAVDAARAEFEADWATTLLSGGYLAEPPDCPAAPDDKPEHRYRPEKVGAGWVFRCPFHGTSADHAAKAE